LTLLRALPALDCCQPLKIQLTTARFSKTVVNMDIIAAMHMNIECADALTDRLVITGYNKLKPA
jgi:hypothetical protein